MRAAAPRESPERPHHLCEVEAGLNQPFDSAANGRAAAMIYDNDRKLIDFKLKKIPGSTHPYALLNKDGSYQILFPGVDEGEIKDSLPGDATSWAFNPADDTFTEISINSFTEEYPKGPPLSRL